MAWQSTLEQARAMRLGRNALIGLAAGILVGLILGLLIGWVWWPVEWQGPATASAPTAATGSQFEAPEAKALYLGAVADAFVYGTAAGDPNAGAAAAQRLAALGGDMRTALNNAISFYSAQAGSSAQVSNLNALAGALGIPLAAPGSVTADANTSGQAAAPASAAQGAQAAAPAATSNTAANDGSGNWLLTLLTALVLIGGGVYILIMLRRRQQQGEEDGGFVAEAPAPAAASATSFTRDSLNSPVRPPLTPAASVRSTVERPQAAQTGGAHGFDAEEIDEYDADDFDDYGPDDYGSAENGAYRGASAPEDEFDGRIRSQAAGLEDEIEEEDELEEDGQAANRQGPPPGFVTAVGAAPPFTGSRSGGPADVQGAPPADETAAQPGAAQRPPSATLQPPTPSRFAKFTPVESYTATYYLGRADFDHTQNIDSPDGKYVGEYGIGIPASQGLLHDDMNKAIAIEVYLFDKSDDRQLASTKRTLLSLYADDKRTEFTRDRQSQPPIVAQPNTNFQLEGVLYLLDCQIKQVDYTPEGYFKHVIVELVLKRKS